MPIKSYKYYIDELFKIASPIIMGNLGFILLGVGDVIVAGRHSTDTFAAISLANAILSCIFTFGIGLIASISPLLSNYRGQKKSTKKYFYPSIRFSMIIALIISLLIFIITPTIPYFGFEEKLVAPIQQYMIISAFSTFGACLHACLKEFLQSFEIVMFPNLLTIICVFLNVILNIIFVFGYGPIPSMGAVGLAIATFCVRYFMAFVLLAFCYMNMRFKNYSEKGYYKSLIDIGLPISLAILVEFIAFNGIGIVMGRISGLYAAAQNLACTLTTITFMIPFAISNALAVKVGYANGCNNMYELKKYAHTGIFISVGFMFFAALVYGIFPRQIVGIFTVDEELYKITLPVVYVLSAFQIFDGLQITLSGICKGVKQTGIVLLANFFAYWCTAMPIGFVLAFKFHLNLVGFWIGLVASAVVLCGIMGYKLSKYKMNNISNV